jgi:predicted amidohydrolase
MKIGMIQLLVEGTEPDRNIQRALTYLDKAVAQKCDLVILPETIDFAWTHPAALQQSKPIPGEYSNIFCHYAKQHQLYICVGLTEKEGNQNYNTAILINNQGEIILKHQKINLLEVEFPYYERGNKIEVVDTPLGRIGLNICADNYENGLHIGHALGHLGAQLILSPSSWTVEHQYTEKEDPYAEKWIKPYTTLAQYYNLTIIGVTSVGYIVGGPYEGKKMVGGSLMVSSNHVKQLTTNEFSTELVTIDITLENIERKGTQIGENLIERGYKFIQQIN